MLWGSLSPSTGEGQGVLLAARLEIEVPTGPGAVHARLALTLLPGDSASTLPLSLLTTEGVRVEGIRVGDVPLSLSLLRPHYWRGEVPVDGEGTLEIHYSVTGAWEEDGRVTIPIPAPLWTPLDPGPGTFRAVLTVPEGMIVTESFPTSVLRRPPGLEGGELELSLQSVPSMLILRTSQGSAPLVTLPRLLDLTVLFLLLAMGVMGLRYLRRVQG
jgi:hypothetical protein